VAAQAACRRPAVVAAAAGGVDAGVDWVRCCCCGGYGVGASRECWSCP